MKKTVFNQIFRLTEDEARRNGKRCNLWERNLNVNIGNLANYYGQRMLLGCRKARNTYRRFVRKLLGKLSLGRPTLSFTYYIKMYFRKIVCENSIWMEVHQDRASWRLLWHWWSLGSVYQTLCDTYDIYIYIWLQTFFTLDEVITLKFL